DFFLEEVFVDSLSRITGILPYFFKAHDNGRPKIKQLSGILSEIWRDLVGFSGIEKTLFGCAIRFHQMLMAHIMSCF
ncbi:hypothetical protein P3389_26860, partial [Vibrio parahaemolyticus]|nr:hypothetical protein [Vibrio parahaemolyticus]